MTQKEETSRYHCMVVYAYYPLGETRVQREAEALVAHGYQVDVIALRGREEIAQEQYRGVHVYRLPLRIRKNSLIRQFLNYVYFLLLAAVKLAQFHGRHPYHTVQVHNLPDFLVFCALIPKIGGVPVILDLHDLMPEFYAGRFPEHARGWLARLVRLQERLACKFADHVITVSEHWRQALIKRGVPSSKCSVVMNVADEKIFKPQEEKPKLASNNKFELIYHGSLVYRYGLDLAIQAVDRVRHTIPHIHLTLLGDGDYIPALIRMRDELGLEEFVTIYDELRPAEELPGIIQQADLGIVPYRNDVFTDGLLPTKLMEYAAMGLPSIASSTTAMQLYFSNMMVEFFEPGDVEGLADCIQKLYAAPQRMAVLRAGCALFNEHYNWEKLGAEYALLVDQLSS